MALTDARSIGVTIDCPFAIAYDFAHRPENFARWAAGLSSSLRRDGGTWHATTPLGEATVEFSPRNDYGVLDHRVHLPGKPVVHIPLRMIETGERTEVVFTLLRQPDMDDAASERDAGLVEKDLATLKSLLENEVRRD